MFALYPTIFERYLIEVRNRKLKHGCERDPEEIRGVYIHDPAQARRAVPHCREYPDERAEDEEDIDRREKIILQAELERGEGEIKN